MNDKCEALLSQSEMSMEKAKAGVRLAAALREGAHASFLATGPVEYELGGFPEASPADVMALAVLKTLSGLTVSQVRLVLNRADFILDATTTFDAEATAFLAADEALLAAFGQSVESQPK